VCVTGTSFHKDLVIFGVAVMTMGIIAGKNLLQVECLDHHFFPPSFREKDKRYLVMKITCKKTPTHIFNDILRGTAMDGYKQYAEKKFPNGKISNIMIHSAKKVDEEKVIIGEIIRVI
jgi:hypothetical protein